jgi:hypothetical protein
VSIHAEISSYGTALSIEPRRTAEGMADCATVCVIKNVTCIGSNRAVSLLMDIVDALSWQTGKIGKHPTVF